MDYEDKKIGDTSLNIGDKIVLEVGTRVNKEGTVLNNEDSLIEGAYVCDANGMCESNFIYKSYEEEEKLINTKAKEYTIVGIFDYGMNYNGNFYTPSYDLYTLLDSKDEISSVNLYVQYKNPKDYRTLNDEINPKIVNEDGFDVRTYVQDTNDY